MLILLTDGFYECERADGTAFGSERVEALIRGLRDSSAEDVVQGLADEVAVFTRGVPQMDDLTAVICTRRTG